MDFGTLKDLFTEKLIESYSSKSEDGKILFKKFIKTISESETLKTAFIVYKNIENNTIKSEIRANDYLKESLSLFSEFNNNPLVLENRKLVSILKDHGVDLSNLNQKEIHKNLDIVLSTEKNASTLNRIEESKSELINWLMMDKESEEIVNNNNEYVKEGVNTQKFLEIVTNKFNEKYSNLTEEEKNILKVLREDNKEDGKKIVSSLVKETISILNTKIDSHKNNIDIKEKLLETKDTVYSMLENEGDLNNNILKLYDLKNNLKDE